jgi:hypothetical protein
MNYKAVDHGMSCIGSGNRIDRKKAVEFANQVRGSALLSNGGMPRSTDSGVLTPTGGYFKRVQRLERPTGSNNVNEPNEQERAGDDYRCGKAVFVVQRIHRNFDSHRGRSIGTPRAKDE